MLIKVKTNNGTMKCHTDTPYMKRAVCRGCGKQIYWAKTENNKNIPLSIVGDDFLPHFADCPKANDFRKKDE